MGSESSAKAEAEADACAQDLTEESCSGSAQGSIEASLGWALGRVLRAYLREAGSALGDLPGGPRGYHVLSAASQSPACSQQALGKRVGVDRSVMTYLVDDLVADGLVERQADPTDRRARRIVVTATGRERVADLHRRLGAVDDRLLRELSADERETFREALRRIAQSVGDDPRVAPVDELVRP